MTGAGPLRRAMSNARAGAAAALVGLAFSLRLYSDRTEYEAAQRALQQRVADLEGQLAEAQQQGARGGGGGTEAAALPPPPRTTALAARAAKPFV